MTTSETSLNNYVRLHVQRGACRCGQCIDAPKNPELKQPQGTHTADMIFFSVSAIENPDKEDFIALVRAEFPRWLDGEEHNYLEMGGDMGDQGIALMTMGLGHILKVWTLITPKIMFGAYSPISELANPELIMQMAQSGYITIIFGKGETKTRPNRPEDRFSTLEIV